MGRIMGIDYGLKRIGIAMTDILQIIASPFDVIKSVDFKKNAETILSIAGGNDVSELVVGLPINMDGSEGEMAEIVKKFVEKIKFLSNIKIETIDERLTTAQAERTLIEEADVSRGKQKALKDKIAASFILQTYLNINR
jgi:putative Holliday junction resolvase